MKRALPLLLLLFSSTLLAQGYEIRLQLPYPNSTVYLGHYWGKASRVLDSATLNAKGEGVFRGAKPLGQGIYLIGDPERARAFEFLVGTNQRFTISAAAPRLEAVRFTGSPENAGFLAYQNFMSEKGRAIDSLTKLRTGKDSVRITAQMTRLNNEVLQYRKELMAREPNGFLTTLLKAMREPEVPANAPPGADSLWAWRYLKAHYWDDAPFYDARLMRTPFFEGRIDKFYEQIVYPSPDSVIQELDFMLGFASADPEMEQYLLVKFLNRYLNQRYMWEDKVFVHLFEKYIAGKQYPWLNDAGRKVVTDRAYSLMSNIFGNPAPEVALPGPDGKERTLYGVNGPYTLVTIWDPTCGHCKEVLPRIDSMYQKEWKARGVRLFALAKETEGKPKDWTDFIATHKLEGWTHVYYSKEAERARIAAGKPGYSQLFDVQSFPTLYLLDKDKRIIAKKLGWEQIGEFLKLKAN